MSASLDTLRRNRSPILIETGTYEGDTPLRIFGYGQTFNRIDEGGYEKVYTIELQERLYELSKERLKGLIEKGLVEIIKGDSATELQGVMDKVNEQATILLDAHIDGGNYIRDVTPDIRRCPLYEELEVIKNHKIKEHIIMIDDVRLLGNAGTWGDHHPVDRIKEIITKINPNYKFTLEEGLTPRDVLVARV